MNPINLVNIIRHTLYHNIGHNIKNSSNYKLFRSKNLSYAGVGPLFLN